MKILNIEIPSIILDVFYNWCDLLQCSRTESNFRIFIQDCSLHFNQDDTYKNKIKIPIEFKVNNNLLCVQEDNRNAHWTITNYDDNELSFLIKIYKKYLDKIK